jgi:LacI family transcriptional regulator/LacI family purine nucleotide synthesis repressor
MAKSVKLADIAEKVGVSVVTVSKALSGQKGVSEQMREKIIKLADELGYKQPSASVKETSEGSGYNIGILIHEKHFSKYNSFYLQMYQMLSARISDMQSYSMLEVITYNMEDELILSNMLREKRVSSLILLGEFSKEYCAFLKKNVSVPTVYLDFNDENQEMQSVISDSFYGSYYLTNYLFEKGHTDIAFVGSLLQTASITDRYLGYLKAMMEHGITPGKDRIIEDRDKDTGIIFEAHKFKLPSKMPTAFVCNCDLTAGELIKKLEEKGYNVPDDISVVGYDNFIFPGVCDVKITTYEVDMKQMVDRTISIVESLLQGKTVDQHVHIVTGHIVEKESVKSIK